MSREKITDTEFYKNLNDIHYIVDDEGFQIISDKELSVEQAYKLFIIKNYTAFKYFIQYAEEHKNGIKKLAFNVNNFLDAYNAIKKEFEELERTLRE